MKTLAQQIKRELKAQTHVENPHWAVYERELQRLWPLNEKNRKHKIEQFAQEYGFKLSFYSKGVCAIFQKDAPKSDLAGQY
jgi:hypothetical protein